MTEIICYKDSCKWNLENARCGKEKVELDDAGQGSEDTDEYLICESYEGLGCK